jgi:molybdenum cofactor biosynthesis protein B
VFFVPPEAAIGASQRDSERRPKYDPRVSVEEHREAAPSSVRCFILTISDTRTPENDPSGDAIAEALTFVGHEVAGRTLVPDDPAQVRSAIVLATLHADAIIATGGTGVTSRDSTYEALNALLERHLDGFGELFRMLSYSEVGAAAMLSRACAGTIGRTVVFSLPGATKAVQLALEKLIVPELPHIVRELRR